jgi:hypothetical protein
MNPRIQLHKEIEAMADATEAMFLQGVVRDVVQQAKRDGQYSTRHQRYRIRAWREHLGSRLMTVTWRVSLDGLPIAGDTEILEIPPRLAASS